MTEEQLHEGYRSMEAYCARFGSQIVQSKAQVDPKDLETITRNALAVMREEGLFAFYLFLCYRWEKGGNVIWPQIKALWQSDAVGRLLGAGSDDREGLIALTKNLHDILLARQLAERTLTYALYGLLAERKAEESKKRTGG